MPSERKCSDYDLIPVCYCAKCYSLKIKHEDNYDFDFCDDCGCTDIASCYVDQWEIMYKNRYGHPFVTRSRNLRNSILFKLTIDDLKKLVFENEQLDEIVHELYPTFPGGLTREETVILLFDKVMGDNRLDDLKVTLSNYLKKQKNG